MNLQILFSSGHGKIGKCVRWASGSKLGHVCVAFQGVVLDPTLDGDLMIPLNLYLHWTPRLSCALVVPVPDPAWSWPQDFRDRSCIPSMVRYLTGGRWPETRDCVGVTLNMLRSLGRTPPKRITTPKELHDYLAREGHQHTDLAGLAASDIGCGSASPPSSDARAMPTSDRTVP